MGKLLESKKRILSVSIISVLLTFFTVVGYEIERFDSLSVLPVTVFAFAGTLILYFFAVSLFFLCLDKIKIKENLKLSRKKVFFIVFFILLVMYIVALLGFFPGMFVFDAWPQYNRYRLGLVSEHHPVLHTVLIGSLITAFAEKPEDIGTGVLVYSIIQMLLSAFSFSYATSYIIEKTKNKLLLIFFAAFWGLFPPIVLSVMSVTKDSLFLVFFVFSVTLLLELFFEDFSKWNYPKVAGLCICVTLMTILRNNCIYIVPILFLASFLLVKKEKRKVLLCVAGGFVLLFLLYKLLFVPAFVTQKADKREMLSIPIQQIMRVYTTKYDEISDEQRELIENLVEEEGREYYPAMADVPKGYFDTDYCLEHKDEVKAMYLDFAFHYPKTMWEAFLATDCGMWYPGSILTLYPWGEKGYWPLQDYETSGFESKLPIILDYYKQFESAYLSDQKLVFPMLFTPGTYFFALLLVFTYCIEKKRKDFIAIGIFNLFYFATFLLGPVALARYAVFLFAMVPFYFLIPGRLPVKEAEGIKEEQSGITSEKSEIEETEEENLTDGKTD